MGKILERGITMTNIKDIKLKVGSYWVKSEKPTKYIDDTGNYYELWGEIAIIPDETGEKLELITI